ncbi:MAG: UDP-glucose--hexose-1-phosphate uridylyltransferase [Succinivibrio sp.]|nr:UDP-glucose--hexose-1-phosphate uridylyltransferase [Succinivibrio sp.]
MKAFNRADHPHRRYNALSGEWILVSPQRAKRPWLGQVEKLPGQVKPSYDKDCYLCPGNPRINGSRNPDYEHNYVFTNDFAALMPEEVAAPEPESELFKLTPVSGTARVICFSADHSKTMPLLSVAEISEVVKLWQQQYRELSEHYVCVQLFENKGAIMGCSNPHPHGQIWACSYLPQELEKELHTQSEYYASHSASLLEDYLKQELEKEERVVLQTRYFAVVVPFWAFWPYETLLLPKFKVSSLPELSAEQTEDLALCIKQLTTRYDNLFGCSFPYSMGWHHPPADGREHPEWQLHAHYYPPLLRSATVKKFVAGFELLAERQRDLTPEQAAARLKELSDRHYSLKD